MTNVALQGIKVLDLTHHIAGPYCAKLLADFGAEVVKIERPGSGDPARRMGPFFRDEPHPEKSLPFLYLNTNKYSVTLDLKYEAGREIVLRLVREADLLVESFSPRVLPSLGLDYEALRKHNPRLVMVSISNFGQTGPYRDYKATEIVEYALGGLMKIFGSSDREPLKHALHQAQFKAGANAATAAAIALYHQRLTGKGQWVDVSVQECIASGLRDTISLYTYMGAIVGRKPPHSGEMPRTPVQVKDGYIVPASLGRVDMQAVADFLDAPKLKEPKFSTPHGRLENAEEFTHIVGQALRRRGKHELFRSAQGVRGLVFGVVYSPEEVVESDLYSQRGYFMDIEHPVVGTAAYPGAPFSMSETPWRARSPAPTLGQHNREIICDRLGYSLQELSAMKASGVV